MPEKSGKIDAFQDEAELVRKRRRRDSTDRLGRQGKRIEQDPSLRGRIIAGLRGARERKLGELLRTVAVEGGFKVDAVAKEVMSLEDEGVLGLYDTRKRPTLFRYSSSPECGWFWNSIAVVAAAVALVFIPTYVLLPAFLSGPVTYLRYFFGAVLVLFLPGYSTMEALYAIKSPFDDLTRYALSLVMSLAIVILISLILGGSPIGLETLPVTVSLGAFSIVMLLIAITRKFDYYRIAHHFD